MSNGTPEGPEGGHLLIIDSDAGVDDAVAILVALKECSLKKGRVLALTSVFGNTTSEQATSNLCRIIGLHQHAEGRTVPTDVPIYRGSELPIMSPKVPDAWDGHGPNGLGGSETEKSVLPLLTQPQEEHAVNAMIRMVKEHPGKIDLVALGPLTNLAMACKLYPPFFSQLRSVHMMGGALHGRGNSGMVAEFNFWADPEAAKIVLEAAPAGDIPVVIVPWEPTELTGASWEFFDRLTTHGTVRSAFVKSISKSFEEMGRKSAPADHRAVLLNDQFVMCDVLPIVALLHPEAIQDAVEAYVDVETVGEHGRGMMAIDWYGYHHKNRPHVTLVQKIGHDALWEIVERVIRS